MSNPRHAADSRIRLRPPEMSRTLPKRMARSRLSSSGSPCRFPIPRIELDTRDARIQHVIRGYYFTRASIPSRIPARMLSSDRSFAPDSQICTTSIACSSEQPLFWRSIRGRANGQIQFRTFCRTHTHSELLIPATIVASGGDSFPLVDSRRRCCQITLHRSPKIKRTDVLNQSITSSSSMLMTAHHC